MLLGNVKQFSQIDRAKTQTKVCLPHKTELLNCKNYILLFTVFSMPMRVVKTKKIFDNTCVERKSKDSEEYKY